MRCLELIAAALVAAEVAILLIGVIARYVFRSPLIWTDELAQAVFLWLGMIGATVALNRGEHMRMTALIVRAAPGPRRGLEAFAAAAGLVFLAAVLQPAIEYVQEVTRIEMPGLGVSKAWLTAPLPCGFAVMIVVAVVRLFRAFPVGLALALMLLAAAAAVLAPMADPWLEQLGQSEPDPVLPGRRRRRRARRRADRDCLRGRHVLLHGADHGRADAAVRRPVL